MTDAPDTKYPDDEQALRLLRILGETPQISQREISQRSQVSLGAVNFCLRALVDKGLVKMRNFRNSRNRQAYAYVLTPQGVSEKVRLTRLFLERKLAEYEELRTELEALEAQEQTHLGKEG
ncbi:MarR family EPS-associated transcriptional regulator [Mameliella alba]|uniref:Transcriptional regulator, MarR family n=1 Tax=Mameliella alba TaxID=561184 RepID=A0A0B3RQM7_9RHOB|nr:MarR family EPS-associated transcriptional regulator [Mameliella alba]KHQ50177.1 Transcriptional regulator, MarR family [Mameliella alba]